MTEGKPDRWFIVSEWDGAHEFSPLRKYIPFDFDWNPPAAWCLVNYEPVDTADGIRWFATIRPSWVYTREALDDISRILNEEWEAEN